MTLLNEAAKKFFRWWLERTMRREIEEGEYFAHTSYALDDQTDCVELESPEHQTVRATIRSGQATIENEEALSLYPEEHQRKFRRWVEKAKSNQVSN